LRQILAHAREAVAGHRREGFTHPDQPIGADIGGKQVTLPALVQMYCIGVDFSILRLM
jgi:hypothetical protein